MYTPKRDEEHSEWAPPLQGLLSELSDFYFREGKCKYQKLAHLYRKGKRCSLGLFSLTDGIYTIKPGDRNTQTYCKFNEHGGGWTLMLTSATDNGWTRDNVKSRNTDSPSLTADFSILEMADKITNMKHFQVKT